MLLLGNELEKLKGCIRAGIIPYVKTDDGLFFLMGVDKKHKELSDFGGGIKNNESLPVAGKRELFEEVKELLNENDIGEIKCGIYDRHNSTCVMFCEIRDNQRFYTLADEFKQSVKDGDEYNEMESIRWIDVPEMIQLVYSTSSCIWSRIRFTLLNTGEFDDHLLAML